tara:strand:+ start:242 stop:442 length:201 start_codon:yes stop_codon:yes gene_type:complete
MSSGIKTYSVQLQETVVRECIVEANNKEEAMEIARAVRFRSRWEWIETIETEMFEPIEFGPGMNNG